MALEVVGFDTLLQGEHGVALSVQTCGLYFLWLTGAVCVCERERERERARERERGRGRAGEREREREREGERASE